MSIAGLLLRYRKRTRIRSAIAEAFGDDAPADSIAENEPVTVEYATGRTGIVYAPTAPTRARPVFLLLDPAGNAARIVRRYMPAANRHECILASSTHVRNGTSDSADADELMALLEYVSSDFDVDRSRVFAAGFSGGGCGAYRLAVVRSPAVSGAIVECGHMGPWREVGSQASSNLSFFLFTRDDDFNRPATGELAAAMTRAGCRVRSVQRRGGHAPMQGEEIEAAIAWMLEG